MPVLKIVLYCFSAFALISVLIPFVKKDYWVFRIFDYPRLQKLSIIAILCVLWLLFFRMPDNWWDEAVVSALLVSFGYLSYLVIPFTPLGKKMIEAVKEPFDKPCLNLLVSNIYQHNRHYQKLLDLVAERNPDLIFLLETDRQWMENVQQLKKTYPHCIEIPKENTYGLLFYSKFKLEHTEINYLIDEEVPSIIADITFDNRTVRVYGLHPTPPVPQENSHSTDRDAEILMVGKMAKEHKGPCLVFGDLNDVAWSYTTELFLKSSGLLDPRRGRGMYSTFHAKYPLLRWPLDHYFLSSHFRLVRIKVEKNINSDHFPISICLVLSHKDEENQMEADADEKALADEKIAAGINNEPL